MTSEHDDYCSMYEQLLSNLGGDICNDMAKEWLPGNFSSGNT
jgi:hypothetical protein